MIERIETPRLLLRGWTGEDVDPFADMMSDPNVMRYYARPMERRLAVDAVPVMRQRLEENGYGRFVLEIKGTAGFAGMMVLDDIRFEVPFEPRREIGWLLPATVWGKGYAPEAAAALLQFAFERLRWPEVVAMATAKNLPSQRVMQKIGMTHDETIDLQLPTLRGTAPVPCVLYRAKSHEW